jgi:hypothetical protein
VNAPPEGRIGPQHSPMIHTLRLAAAVCALALPGCYSGTVTYVRPHAQLRTDGATLFSAVEATVSAQGLRVLRSQRERGLVVAVTAPVRMGDLKTRERWRIAVRAGDVSVEMHPETRDDDAADWERDTRVCDCYHYAREREMLEAIRARLRAQRGV